MFSKFFSKKSSKKMLFRVICPFFMRKQPTFYAEATSFYAEATSFYAKSAKPKTWISHFSHNAMKYFYIAVIFCLQPFSYLAGFPLVIGACCVF